MDEYLNLFTEEFITDRINFHGKNESREVNDAYMAFRAVADKLRETLSDEQLLLLRAAENAYHIADGETIRYYYKSGFGDVMQFNKNNL